MKKVSLIVGLTLSLFALGLLVPRHAASARDQFSHVYPPIGTAQVFLTNAQVDPSNNEIIRAFIPTGSTSQNCLATMSDTNNAVTGMVLFCAERQPIGLGNVPGAWVSIFFPSPVVPDLTMTVTVYQEGAKLYGPPVLCTSAQGC